MPHLWPWRYAARMGLGVVLFGAACATAVSQNDREAARMHHDLGVASLDKGDTREALRALMAARRFDPELPQVHHALGLVLHTMGQDQAALRSYEKAIACRPDFSEAYNNMGILLLDMGRYPEAVRAFEQALGNLLYSTPYLAEGNLGWTYYKMGDVARARQHIEAAVSTEPRFCRGYEWLARIAFERNEPDAGTQLVHHSKRFYQHCLSDPHVARGIAADYRREMQYYWGMGLLKQGATRRAAEQFARCAAGFDADTDAGPNPGDTNLGQFARRCAQSAAQLGQATRP